MYTLKFLHIATGVFYREDFASVSALIEREEELSRIFHWAGGNAYGQFSLIRH